MKTKYQKTKQLMKSTGLSKKECQTLLRSCKWDYDAAYDSTLLVGCDGVDWVHVSDALVNAINALTELVNRLAEELPIILDTAAEAAKRILEKEEQENEPIQKDH